MRTSRPRWRVAVGAAALAVVLAPAVGAAAGGLSTRAKPPAPVICTAQQDFDAVYGVGSPPVPQVEACLVDYTFNDDLHAGNQVSDYVPVSPLLIDPSTSTVTFNKTMTITLDLGYPTCTPAQLANGPSPTPCSYDPEILTARWIPQNQGGYLYPTSATFNACGQDAQGQLPTGVDSITCSGSFSAPASELSRLDPNAWFVIRARAQVDSSDPSINGEEYSEHSVSVQLTGTTPTLPAPVTVGFAARSSSLSAADRAALTSLAAKLSPGASVRVTGYAKTATLAHRRAAAAAAFLQTRVTVTATLKAVTTPSANRATVVTIAR